MASELQKKMHTFIRGYTPDGIDPHQFDSAAWYKLFLSYIDQYASLHKINYPVTGVYVNKITYEGHTFSCGYIVEQQNEHRFCLSYSAFDSEYAEFVPFLLDEPTFVDYYTDTKLAAFEEVEELLALHMTDEKFRLDAVIIGAVDRSHIENTRLNVRVMVTAICNLLYEIRWNYVINNVNKYFAEFVSTFMKSETFAAHLVNSPVRRYKRIEVAMYERILILGCKFFPMTNLETVSTDWLLQLWQQKLAHLRLNDVVVNMIGWCFPTMYYDSYLRDVDAHLFQNPRIAAKYRDTMKVGELAERVTGAVDDDYELTPPAALRAKRLINFAHAGLALSDVAYIDVQEWCGYTMVHSEINLVGGNRKIGDVGLKKLIFDVVYGFLLLHQCNIIHGDPHLNNITFNYYTRIYEQAASISLYEIGGEHYFIPEVVLHSVIIDYSAAFVLAAVRGVDERPVFPFKAEVKDRYFQRLLTVLRERGKIAEDSLPSRALFDERPDLIWKCAATLDLFSFTNYAQHWKMLQDHKDTFPLSIKALDDLRTAAGKELEFRFDLLRRGDITRIASLKSPFPRIISETFSNFKNPKINWTEYGLYNPAKHPCDPAIARVFNPAFEEFLHFRDLSQMVT